MTDPVKLEEGWYLVRRHDDWFVAELYDGLWWVCGSEVPIDQPPEIGPRIHPPKEDK